MRARLVVAGAVVILAAGAAWYFLLGPGSARTLSPGSPAYVDLVRVFYRGLASLDAGLIDNARADFTRATELAPGEPAAWINLAVTHLRVGEFEPAAASLDRASALAPASADVALVRGLADASRGEVDAAAGHFRRALDIDPDHLRARFALAEAIERAGGAGADAEAQRQIEQLLAARPDNLVLLLERARLAAKRGEVAALRAAADALAARSAGWPAVALEQLQGLQRAAVDGDSAAAARAAAFLRNVLARLPAFREGLVEMRVPVELVAEPLTRFVSLPVPPAMPAPPDEAIAYARQPLARPAGLPGPAALIAAAASLVFTAPPGGVSAAASGTLVLDWNHDFVLDLLVAGPAGTRLFIQETAGRFTDVTARAADDPAVTRAAASGAWAADVEMDGDLDVVLGLDGGPPVVLRNNADGTWRTLRPWAGVAGVRALAWGDLDRDGDPDPALLDAAGVVHVFANQQAGEFERRQAPAFPQRSLALAMADARGEGVLDLLALDAAGTVTAARAGAGGWMVEAIVRGGAPASAAPGGARLFAADLDNNGALDLVASSGTAQVWLGAGGGEFRSLPRVPPVDVFAIADVDRDGRLDWLAMDGGEPVRMIGSGARDYHWQVIRPRAQQRAGDQRINAFGVGGEIEVRAGLLVQKQLLTGAPVHLGLGEHTTIDVARIVWPNGVAQAEFDLAADGEVVAEQRLKGSCPWVFTYDGTGMTFVTDFLWRSPLGLRINAQDTTGSDQTEDWVKIRGDQLAARDGAYDVRITAELWETHYFDHVALLAVDHPEDVEVFIDERFARTAPARVVRAVARPRSVTAARDDGGREVSALVAQRDGRHLGGFAKTAYQGLARDHFVEFDVGPGLPANVPLWLIAHGWVYPTDSSINVALAQGAHPAPRGVAVEARGADGRWRVLDADAGFPAGKHKTMVIDLSAVARGTAVTRVRLRTNMEVYWDWLAYAPEAEAGRLTTVRLEPAEVELRFRGYSRTSEDRAAYAPETPEYGRIANTAPRWRDLVGYHTRFGDVRELLAGVDDRYAILNAGDELRFRFPALPAPATGTARDFVLIGDGWEKDGDFNTGYSKTVQPLPRHGVARYEPAHGSLELEDDPAYRAHPGDWQRFHTRFVAPDRFLQGVRPR